MQSSKSLFHECLLRSMQKSWVNEEDTVWLQDNDPEYTSKLITNSLKTMILLFYHIQNRYKTSIPLNIPGSHPRNCL